MPGSPGVDSVLASQWAQVRGRLRSEFGEATYPQLAEALTLLGQSDCQVSIAVKTRFMRDWISQHYAERIRALWHAANPEVRGIEFVVDGSRPQAMKAQQRSGSRRIGARAGPNPGGRSRCGNPRAPTPAATFAPEDVSAPLDPRFTFENFVVGKSNELAHAAAQRVAEARAVPFNPLFLYGGVGLGKTHLMHAIAWHIRKRTPQRRVIYLSAEKFMYQFIRALRQQATSMAFKEQFRSVDVLMIDDVQFISGKDSTQEEFFHTFNALVDQNRQVVISADKSPSDLEGLEERMRSRLGWGLVADIHPTTYELRLGILQSKAEQMKARGAAQGAGVPGPQDHLQRARAGGRAEPHRRPCHADRPPDHPGDDAGGAARPAARQRPAGHHRGDPEAASPSISTSSSPTCIPRAGPAPWPGRARSPCILPSSSPPARCRRSAASSAAATTPR